MNTTRTTTKTRRPRADGARSRETILRAAAGLATVEGLDGLSIGHLAEHIGMSKSGLYAHFGSKEELQLATIEAANRLFDKYVVEPAAAAATGIEGLQALTENYLRYVEGRIFAGGCFFASLVAEMDTQQGPVRDRALAFMDDWMRRLEAAVRTAQAEGAIAASEDPGQLAFELEAIVFLANAQFVLAQGSEPIDRARRALERRLRAASSGG